MREKERGLASPWLQQPAGSMQACRGGGGGGLVAGSQLRKPLHCPWGQARHFHCQSAGAKALFTSCKAGCNVRPALDSG